MRPLELIVRPRGRDPYGQPVYVDPVRGFYVPEVMAAINAHRKHRTDSQLAAEYWQASDAHTRTAGNVLGTVGSLDNLHMLAAFEDKRSKMCAPYRFITAPHALGS